MQLSKDLVLNGTTVSAFRHAIHSCNIDAVPGIVRKLLDTGAWRSFVVNRQLCANQTFAAFIQDPPFKGCGWELEKVQALIQQSGDADLLREWRKHTTAPVGHPVPNTDIVSIRPGHGNSLPYTLDRLKRKNSELYAKVVAGELSANAAAIQADIRKKPAKRWKRCPHCGHEL